MNGKQIAQYQVIGEPGGRGVTGKALDTRQNRFVALELLPPSGQVAPELRQRLINEARAASALGHPGIPTVYEIFEHDGRDCVVSEFLAGHTLAEQLRRARPQPEQIIAWAIEIADALAAAHRANLVHRALNPANLFVTDEGHIKVLGFGFARLAHEAAPDASAYLAPEQTEGRKVDTRTDLYSLGVVLHQLATGTLPAAEQEPPPLPASACALDIVIGGCLRKDPSRRFQHVNDIRLVLEQRRPELRRSRWKPVVAGLALLAAGGIGASAVFLLTRPAPAPTGLAARRMNRITWDGTSTEPALSRDGRMVAFLSGRMNRPFRDIFVQRVGTGTARQLTNEDTAVRRPVFSADGSRIYYFSNRAPAGIYEVPTAGGESHLLIPDGFGIRPSPDGKWLAYLEAESVGSRPAGPNAIGRLRIRPAEGGEARTLMPSTWVSGDWVAWSADSRELLVGGGAYSRAPNLYRVPIDGSTPSELPPFAPRFQRLGFTSLSLSRLSAWFPDGSIAIPARFGDAVNLFRIRLPFGDHDLPAAITVAPFDNSDHQIAGNRIVFAHRDYQQGVWSQPADVNAGRVTGPMHRISGERSEAQYPDVRPNGQTLVYQSRDSGVPAVFIRDLNTGRERSLPHPGVHFAYATLSPDGTRLAVAAGMEGWQTYVIPLATGTRTLIGRSFGRLRGWSPDGRYLLVWRALPPRDSLGVLDTVTGKATEIAVKSDADLIAPRLSPDGRWLLFTAYNGDTYKLMVAPFHGAQPIPEQEWIWVTADAPRAFWSPDSRSIYFIKSGEPWPVGAAILRQPFDPAAGNLLGPPVEFMRLDSKILGSPLTNSICANRNQIFINFNSGPSDIWMTELP